MVGATTGATSSIGIEGRSNIEERHQTDDALRSEAFLSEALRRNSFSNLVHPEDAVQGTGASCPQPFDYRITRPPVQGYEFDGREKLRVRTRGPSLVESPPVASTTIPPLRGWSSSDAQRFERPGFGSLLVRGIHTDSLWRYAGRVVDDKFIAASRSFFDCQSGVPAEAWSISAPRSKRGTPAIATTPAAGRTQLLTLRSQLDRSLSVALLRWVIERTHEVDQGAPLIYAELIPPRRHCRTRHAVF